MSTKTVSLKKEAYDKLRAARQYATESFSEVVLRARWAQDTLTGRGLLERGRKGPHFTSDEIDRMEALKRADLAPEDKWAGR